jgi:hypothetical protein
MVDSHPEIAVLPEGGWFGTWFEHGMGLTKDGCVTREIVPMLLKTHKNIDLGATAGDLYAMVEPEGKVAYADFVSNLFARCGRKRGKGQVGSKNPDYLRHLPTLRRLWPQAKFVHIIRDGRDVCLSASARWRGKPEFRGFPFFLYEKPDRIFDDWKEDPVITCGLWWEWTVRLGREFGATLPANMYYEMRYEQLVANPRQESEDLCEFLGIPFSESMLRHEENFTPRRGGDGKILHASVALPVTPGLRNWRSEMEPKEVERFEAAAGMLLDELGYPRADLPRAAYLHEAARIREIFERVAGAPVAPRRSPSATIPQLVH